MTVTVQDRCNDRRVRCAAGEADGVQVVHIRDQIWDPSRLGSNTREFLKCQNVCGGSQYLHVESQRLSLICLNFEQVQKVCSGNCCGSLEPFSD